MKKIDALTEEPAPIHSIEEQKQPDQNPDAGVVEVGHHNLQRDLVGNVVDFVHDELPVGRNLGGQLLITACEVGSESRKAGI